MNYDFQIRKYYFRSNFNATTNKTNIELGSIKFSHETKLICLFVIEHEFFKRLLLTDIISKQNGLFC